MQPRACYTACIFHQSEMSYVSCERRITFEQGLQLRAPFGAAANGGEGDGVEECFGGAEAVPEGYYVVGSCGEYGD